MDASLLTAASPWNIPVQVVDETTSSNDEVLRSGEKGAPNGTLLFAERQTAGRGQFRRPWASSEPLGLWFSLLLRLEISDATIPALSAFAAVALVETIESLGIPDSRIKAPNDIHIQGRKVAGIQVEKRTGKTFERESVATSLLGALGKCEQLMHDDPAALLVRWNSLLLSAT